MEPADSFAVDRRRPYISRSKRRFRFVYTASGERRRRGAARCVERLRRAHPGICGRNSEVRPVRSGGSGAVNRMGAVAAGGWQGISRTADANRAARAADAAVCGEWKARSRAQKDGIQAGAVASPARAHLGGRVVRAGFTRLHRVNLTVAETSLLT